MKELILCLLTLFSLPSTNAQHFKLFVEGKQHSFQTDNGSIHINSFDSVRVYGADKWIYNYKYNQDLILGYTPCNNLLLNSWLGNYFIEKQNGSYIFFNHDNDSILIQTDTSKGPWKLMNIGANFIQASFNKQKNNDSTIFINFQAKDTNGLNINHPINNQEIIISKFNGILKALDFYHLPNTYVYNNVGSTNPNNGITNLKTDSIYNYNVGDVFHTYYEGEFWSYRQHQLIKIYTEWIITSKSGLKYYYKERNLEQKLDGYNNPTITVKDNTIIKNISYTPSYLDINPYVNIINNSGKPSWSELYFDSSLNKVVKEVLGFGACKSKSTYGESRIFCSGLGEFKNTYSDGNKSKKVMLYYKKGNNSWGHPINFDSVRNVFFTGIDSKVIDNNIIIHPVPTKNELNILSDTPFKTYLILNALGEMIEEKNLGNKNINISHLANGIYFLKLINEDKVITKKFIKE